jgi:ankyrin repeat protein
MDVMRELENFPEVNLNQKDENGDTSFMLYLKNSDLDENVLIKMLENGANLTDITDFGQSTLDLVMQNKKTSEVNKKLILSKMFRLGVRSKHKNFLIKVYRNLRSKY